jgi:hypothetical protein
MNVEKFAYRATLAFILTIPLENTLEVPGLGRVSRAMGLLSGLIWLAAVVRRGGLRRLHPFHGAYALFLIWCGITLFWSVDPRSSVSGFITLAQIFGMLIIIWDLFRTRPQIEAALQAFVLGAGISAVAIIQVYATSPTPIFPAHERYTIGSFEVDGIALILALAIPAAWYLGIHQGKWSDRLTMRVVNFADLPTAVFAMVLTGTRGAVVASIPSAIFVVWSIWKSTGRTRILGASAVILAGLLIAMLAPPALLGRIGSAVDNLAGAGDRSETIWRRSLEVFNTHPIVGIGLDAHRVAVPLGFHITKGVAHSSIGKEAHNTPISILVETGLIGLAVAGALGVILVRSVSRLSGPDVRYWASQLAVIALGAQTLSLEDSKSMWLFFGLAVAASVAGRVPSAQRRIASPSVRIGASPIPLGAGAIIHTPTGPQMSYSDSRKRSMGLGR